MVRIKICGITNLADATAAIDSGADMLGFIFTKSPRKAEPWVVKEVVASLPQSVIKVGVFMNQDMAEIRDTMTFCKLDMAQLHGDESAQFCADLGYPVIKAFTPQTLPIFNHLQQHPADIFMLDRMKGSNTEPRELWPIAREMMQYGKVLLAGALTPDNVADAIKYVQPYGVDVASGVEKEPGIKNHQKVINFIYEVRRNQGETT